MMKTITLTGLSLILSISLYAATVTPLNYNGVMGRSSTQSSSNWSTVTIKYTNITDQPINLANSNLGFLIYSKIDVENPYFTSLCGVSEPSSITLNEEKMLNGPFAFYVFNLKFTDPSAYTYLDPNSSVEITFGTPYTKDMFIAPALTPGYYYSISTSSEGQNPINTTVDFLYSTQQGFGEYGTDDNCVMNDEANHYFIWGYPSLPENQSDCAGILEVQGTGAATGTNKLVAVTPQGFYLASPSRPSQDNFEIAIQNDPNHSSLKIVAPSTQLNDNKDDIIQNASFTLIDNTSNYRQYNELGIPCYVSVVSSNGVIFSQPYGYLDPNNGSFTMNYTVTSTDAAAVVEIKDKDGVPRTCKLLLITANGIFQATGEDDELDDFELTPITNTTTPTFSVTPNTYNVLRKNRNTKKF